MLRTTVMYVIQPNCRIQFTAEDIDFIAKVLGKETNTQALIDLLTDPDCRDSILEDEALVRALLEERGCLRVSTHFYFYVLVRHVLRQTGINDRSVADYVAELLSQFSREGRARLVTSAQPNPLDYVFEMLAALQKADDHEAFFIRAHIGNHSLFLSGVFPDRIRHRSERGFPDLRYYEELGRTNYRVASGHRLARRYDLAPVFEVLSERFAHTRKALNDLSDRVFSLGDPEIPMHNLFKG